MWPYLLELNQEISSANPNLLPNPRMINLGTRDDREEEEEEEEDSLKCGATLKSRRGTVRGVKNRVRQGIATFLKDKSKKVGGRERCWMFTMTILFYSQWHVNIDIS